MKLGPRSPKRRGRRTARCRPLGSTVSQGDSAPHQAGDQTPLSPSVLTSACGPSGPRTVPTLGPLRPLRSLLPPLAALLFPCLFASQAPSPQGGCPRPGPLPPQPCSVARPGCHSSEPLSLSFAASRLGCPRVSSAPCSQPRTLCSLIRFHVTEEGVDEWTKGRKGP